MKNVHITLTEFRNESRLIRQVRSLLQSGIFEEISVLALGSDDLPKFSNEGSGWHVKRIQPVTRKLPKISFFQIFKLIEFNLRCFIYIRKNKSQVVTIHTLALLPLGYLLKIILKMRVVYDAHELETETNGLSGWRQRGSKFVERYFIYSCDLVTVVSDSIADWYSETYQIPRPLVIKNTPPFRKLEKKGLFRQKLNIRNDQTIFIYQGVLSLGRGINVLIKAFNERHEENAVMIFMGYGELEDQVKEVSKNTKNIFFVPAVNPDQVLDYTASADIGICYIEKTCLSYYYCMPNKLFEYAMAGLPILVSNMKDMSECVEKNKFGLVLSDPSPLGVNGKINDILSMNYKSLSYKAHQFASDNSWEHQHNLLLEGYQKVLKL